MAESRKTSIPERRCKAAGAFTQRKSVSASLWLMLKIILPTVGWRSIASLK
jgi:hypothetical protein